jgi:hypothetical protein
VVDAHLLVCLGHFHKVAELKLSLDDKHSGLLERLESDGLQVELADLLAGLEPLVLGLLAQYEELYCEQQERMGGHEFSSDNRCNLDSLDTAHLLDTEHSVDIVQFVDIGCMWDFDRRQADHNQYWDCIG